MNYLMIFKYSCSGLLTESFFHPEGDNEYAWSVGNDWKCVKASLLLQEKGNSGPPIHSLEETHILNTPFRLVANGLLKAHWM